MLDPKVLRFALGDVADRELVAEVLGGPYQFISLPCTPPELMAIIERSLAFDAWLSTDSLRQFVPQLGRLPGLPATYFEVLKRAESSNASIESVAEVVARDPTLTARLLQTVNSAASGLQEKVTDPAEAVARLGVETVKSLVLCLQVFNAMPQRNGPVISLDKLWRHSYAVAQYARQLAQLESGEARLANDAFTAGLLHRVGQIVLVTHVPERYREVLLAAREEQKSLDECEHVKLDVTASQVGGYLLALWGMPLPIVEAIAYCAQPAQRSPSAFSLLTAVHVANVLALDDEPLVEGVPPPKLDRQHLDPLQLPHKLDAWRKRLTAPDRATEAPPEEQPRPASVPAPGRLPVIPMAELLKWAIITSVIVIGGGVGLSIYRSSAAAGGHGMAVASAKTLSRGWESTPEDDIKLEGVFYRAGKSAAVINGHLLSTGQAYNDLSVLAINPASVVVRWKGRELTLKLK